MDAAGPWHDPSCRLNRRRFLQVSGTAAAGLTVGGRVASAVAAPAYLGPSAYPFAPSTPENTKIPLGEPLDVTSAQVRDALVAAGSRSRVVISQECTIYEVGSAHPFYSVLWNGQPWMFNGSAVTWRVPAGARTGEAPDLPIMLQDEYGHPLFGRQRRLRGWMVRIDDTARTLDAANWSVCDYSATGSPTPVYSTAQRPDGVYTATASGREWVGLVRPEEIDWGLKYGGTVPRPNVDGLKGAIRHGLRGTFGMNLHLPDYRYRAPALGSDASGSGLLEMGMRIRLDPAMTDAEILARVPAKWPAGSSAKGQTWRDRWRMLLWMLLFAARDYGILVSDSTAQDLIVAQFEHEATAHWSSIIGPQTVYYGEVLRDAHANATDGGTRPANAGMPLDRLQVPGRSVYA